MNVKSQQNRIELVTRPGKSSSFNGSSSTIWPSTPATTTSQHSTPGTSTSGLTQPTHFFLFPFYKKSLICVEGKSLTPHRGKTTLFRSSQQLPCLLSRTLEGLFELKRFPSRALNSPHALVPELQSVRCAALGAENPGHH